MSASSKRLLTSNRLPYGASTYSKSHVAFGEDMPLYATHGDDWRLFDVEGQDYCDMIMGLGSVILGHRHPEVDEAIREQLCAGTTLSLGTPIELEAADRLLKHFPNGCMVQWGTNGSDATEGACRLARLITGRKRIGRASDCYHGFHDWNLQDTQRGAGIPLMPHLTFGEDWIKWLTKRPYLGEIDDLAAIIIEPDLHPDWLKHLRVWCSTNGALLIFDEVMTWQRYPTWTASKYYDVQPDLWCLGKSLGNGMPVSAIVGSADVLKRFAPGDQPNAFFSSTWAGHPLSMAAVIATLDVMERERGPQKIWDKASTLYMQLCENPNRMASLGTKFEISGPPFNRIKWSRAAEWRKLMARNNVLIYAAHNLSLAHDANAMFRLRTAWDDTLNDMANSEPASAEPDNGVMRR